MLWRWLDTCIVCTKPNGKDAHFGHIRLIALRDTLLKENRRVDKGSFRLSRCNHLFKDGDTPFSIVARKPTIQDIQLSSINICFIAHIDSYSISESYRDSETYMKDAVQIH